jgi:hypothetical protein
MSLREENEEEKKRREIEERGEGIYKQGERVLHIKLTCNT